MNTVIFAGFTDTFMFCRGGVDEKLEAVDPYGRMLNGHKCYVMYNFDEERDALAAFFGYTIEELRKAASANPWNRVVIGSGDYKVVFDNFGDPILYSAKDKDPKRVTKVCKTYCAFFQEWGERCGTPSKEKPYEVNGWKFEKGVKYVRMRRYHMIDLIGLVPELFGIDGPYAYIKKEFEEGVYGYVANRRACDWLYGLEPIDLSKPYGYTEEEKGILVERARAAEEKARREHDELIRRKNTPGYCNECGEEHAEYIPYLERYLCRECFFKLTERDW